MHGDPFYSDPTSAEPGRVPPPGALPPMEELQPKQAPPPHYEPVAAPAPAAPSLPVAELEMVNRENEARTLVFAIGKFKDFLWWFLAVLEVALLLRFIFRLIAADPGNAFAGLLYALTGIILLPFNGIVKTPSLHNWAFEWPTLIAMAVYALIFLAITSFLRLLISTPKEPAE
ncbi:YggT family protein [Thermogemmatispora onikobensis]|uniref:YggT family protein n=1 Tax=Thermogemmatispora onikobensis TaxID=732234 RepID=UPI000852C1AF|nr:YggT family protein [Thermogemmatispora onikobensis]